jgi:prepilin-type N-terminal cleavage/methylation domain-containing protein/prepilin-type processing-associated H-X9-DG protein
MKLNTRTSQLRQTPERKGFTLIELLVVIAIIALLASILFPVFSRARENARRTTCQSNLKQIGLGMTMYAQDYDETYPKAFAYGATGAFPSGGLQSNSKSQSWDVQIEPYMSQKMAYAVSKTAQLFKCPSDYVVRGGAVRTYSMAGMGSASAYTSGPDCRTNPSGNSEGDMNLGFAGEIHGDDADTSKSPPDGYCYSRGRKLSEFPDPSGTLEMAEFPQLSNSPDFPNFSVVLRPVSTVPKTTCTVTWASSSCGQDGDLTLTSPLHFEGWNYLFADGHVKWLRPEKTVGPTGTTALPKGMWSIAEGD